MSYVNIGSVSLYTSFDDMVERPVTAGEARTAGGAIVAVVRALHPGLPLREEQKLIRQIAAANGVPDPGSHSCVWARNLAKEVMKRGGRRGPVSPDNRCEPGQGFAIIQAGNVWKLPPSPDAPPPSASTPKPHGKSRWPMLAVMGAGIVGLFAWSRAEKKHKKRD